MTINIADNSPRISYSVSDGVTQTSFAVPFEFFDDEDLNVYVDGTLKTLTSDYTVAGGDGSTGTVTISVTGGSGGSTVVITRDIDLERTTDFPVSGAFNIVALNTELDRLVAIAADLEDLAGRGVKLADFDTQAALTLPLASERGNKVLAFNATGDTLISQELGTWQSDWAASTEYKERDLVRDSSDGSIYIVNSAHTSSGTTPLDTNTNSSKYDVIFDVGAMIAGTVTMTGDLTVQGNTTLGNASSDSITMTGTAANLRMSTTNVTDILDEDTMSSDSATALATQQSIKAYVDSQVGASDTLTEILGNGNTTSGTNLVVSSGDTLNVDGALDASGTISLGGNFPTGTDNVALGSSALGAVLSAGERNTIIGSAAGDGITNGDDNTALGAGALGSITTQSSNTAVGRNALTSTTGTANTALGNGAGSQITSGQYNTVLGLFNGNQNSLDIRTSSNNVVLSDGQGNVRFYANSSGNVGLGSVSPDAELHISSSSSTPKIIIENSTNPRGNFIGSANNGDLVLGADEDSLSGSSAIRFKVDGTEVMSLDYQGTLGLTGNATFGDNDKAIFGAGSDLQIYHNAFNSIIQDSGTGNLYLGGDNLLLTNAALSETYLEAVTNGEVNIRYDGSTKLATTSTGVDITGTAVTDGVTVAGNLSVDGGTIKLDGNYPVGTQNVALGDAALDAVTSGARNVAIGWNSLTSVTTANYNVAVGGNALALNTASNNTALGDYALTANTTGDRNTAVGQAALLSNTTGVSNDAFGSLTLDANTTGSFNVAIGRSALSANTTASNNTAVGHASLASSTTASYNTAVGYQAGNKITTGNYTVAIGYQALLDLTTGRFNVAVGSASLYEATTADDNVAIGRDAMHLTTTGNSNTSVGSGSLFSNTTASNNTAVGYQAGYDNTTGYSLTAIGRDAAHENTTGAHNTAVGHAALYTNTTGNYNTAIGRDALNSNTTADYNTAVGRQAGYNTTTGIGNTVIGHAAGLTNTTGYQNVYLGSNAGYSSTGYDNTFVGGGAGYSSTGAGNTFLGREAGQNMINGSNNTILGSFNGNEGGLDIRTSNNNIVLSDGDGNPRLYIDSSGDCKIGGGNTSQGYQADGLTAFANGETTLVRDGNPPVTITRKSTAGSAVVFYNTTTLSGTISVNGSSTSYNTSSDYRLKENVVDLTGATDRLKQLNPSRFNFIADADTTVDGFLAHEVQAVVPEAITGTHNEVDADGNPVYQGIDQSKLVPLLVATIKELEARITALENA